MTDEQYRAFLDLLMCCDPWPVSNDENDHTQTVMTDLANAEARRRGFTDWIDAYHRFDLANDDGGTREVEPCGA